MTNSNTNQNPITSLTINEGEFRILQVTDMHITFPPPWKWGREKTELKWITKTAKANKVDLIVNTGDLFCRNASFLIQRVLHNFEKYIGSEVPWTFAWGNHDNENYYGSFMHLDKIEETLESLPGCIYFKTREYFEHYNQKPPDIQFPDEEYRQREQEAFSPTDVTKEIFNRKFDGFYGGNFAIELNNPENEDSANPQAILFMLNSRRQFGVPPPVQYWMANYLKKFTSKALQPPVFCFYHVPNHEYDDIWNENIVTGEKGERVCIEGDNGHLHRFFTQLPKIKGCFVGHDHVNDYYGTKDGITYVYGRKTGTLGGYGSFRNEGELPKEFIPAKKQYEEGKEQDSSIPEPVATHKAIVVGAKLITLNFKTGTWSFKSIRYDSKTEYPSPEYSLE